MDEEQKALPILIYYNMRGQAQAIRGLFCYLEIQFVEIHLERFEQQKKTLPLTILSRLKKLKIDKSLLPILLDDQEMIFDTFPIMAYLCYKHQHEHLLGRSIEEKARLQEIIEVYNVKQPLSMAQFFRFSEYSVNRRAEQIYSQMCKSYSNLMAYSEYLKQLCNHIQSHYPQRYILKDFSILDLLFLESCTYMLGVFDNLDKKFREQEAKMIHHQQIDGIKREYLIYLAVMRNFRERMLKQPFYLKKQEFLESFSIITPLLSQERIKGIRKVWIGNKKLIR